MAEILRGYSETLEYPQISMYEAVVNAGKTHSQVNAYEFQGKGTTYAKFIEKSTEPQRLTKLSE